MGIHAELAVGRKGGLEELLCARPVAWLPSLEQHLPVVVLRVGKPGPRAHAGVQLERVLEVVHRFVGTEWEPYIGVAFCLAFALSFTMMLSG